MLRKTHRNKETQTHKSIKLIMKIGLYRYNLPFINPIKLLDETMESRSGLLIYKDGGWGEICPLPGFSYETIDEAQDEALTYIHHLVSGTSYFPELPSVQHGVDCMNSKFEYSQEEYDKFPPNYTFLLGNPKEITYNWFKLIDNFPHTVKIKVGRHSLKEELKMLKEICKKSPDVKMILDANGLWTKEEALSIMGFLNKENIEYIEDPCNNLDDSDFVSQQTGIPIALDQLLRFCPITDWGNFSNLKAVIIKPSIIGGSMACNAICEQAQLFNIKIVASSLFESQLGNYNIREIARKKLDCKAYHGLDTNKYFKYSVYVYQSLDIVYNNMI